MVASQGLAVVFQKPVEEIVKSAVLAMWPSSNENEEQHNDICQHKSGGIGGHGQGNHVTSVMRPIGANDRLVSTAMDGKTIDTEDEGGGGIGC